MLRETSITRATGMETPHQMKQRHKAELKALAEAGGKKAKGSAKEMKQKEDELKKKHEEELKALQNKASSEAAPAATTTVEGKLISRS